MKLVTDDFIGNLGGGSPIIKIAMNVAERSAELSAISLIFWRK
jgi:hypothetical protein